MFYSKKENPAWYKTWEWFRVLAVDGSKIRLPDEKEVKEKYWTTVTTIKNWEKWTYTSWLFSSLYDAENDIAIDSILERWDYNERALAIRHIINLESHIQIEEKDLLIFDRWYFSKFLFSFLMAYQKDFVFRITPKSFKEAMELFDKDCEVNSKIVVLKQEKRWVKDYRKDFWIEIDKTLSDTVKVRFIRVVLDNWDIEVLATSLLDEVKYDSSIFKDLYFKRWRVEVFYGILKDNLSLENFSWKSLESVEQDIYSSIYLSNFETLATNAANLELELKSKEKKLENEQQVNKKVSFNTIKNNIFDLFLSNKSTKKVVVWVHETLKLSPTQKRKWRKCERKNKSANQTLLHHKNKKKQCY